MNKSVKNDSKHGGLRSLYGSMFRQSNDLRKQMFQQHASSFETAKTLTVNLETENTEIYDAPAPFSIQIEKKTPSQKKPQFKLPLEKKKVRISLDINEVLPALNLQQDSLITIDNQQDRPMTQRVRNPIKTFEKREFDRLFSPPSQLPSLKTSLRTTAKWGTSSTVQNDFVDGTTLQALKKQSINTPFFDKLIQQKKMTYQNPDQLSGYKYLQNFHQKRQKNQQNNLYWVSKNQQLMQHSIPSVEIQPQPFVEKLLLHNKTPPKKSSNSLQISEFLKAEEIKPQMRNPKNNAEEEEIQVTHSNVMSTSFISGYESFHKQQNNKVIKINMQNSENEIQINSPGTACLLKKQVKSIDELQSFAKSEQNSDLDISSPNFKKWLQNGDDTFLDQTNELENKRFKIYDLPQSQIILKIPTAQNFDIFKENKVVNTTTNKQALKYYQGMSNHKIQKAKNAEIPQFKPNTKGFQMLGMPNHIKQKSNPKIIQRKEILDEGLQVEPLVSNRDIYKIDEVQEDHPVPKNLTLNIDSECVTEKPGFKGKKTVALNIKKKVENSSQLGTTLIIDAQLRTSSLVDQETLRYQSNEGSQQKFTIMKELTSPEKKLVPFKQLTSTNLSPWVKPMLFSDIGRNNPCTGSMNLLDEQISINTSNDISPKSGNNQLKIDTMFRGGFDPGEHSPVLPVPPVSAVVKALNQSPILQRPDMVRQSFEFSSKPRDMQVQTSLPRDMQIQTSEAFSSSIGSPPKGDLKRTATFFNQKRDSLKLNVQDINEISKPFIDDISDQKTSNLHPKAIKLLNGQKRKTETINGEEYKVLTVKGVAKQGFRGYKPRKQQPKLYVINEEQNSVASKVTREMEQEFVQKKKSFIQVDATNNIAESPQQILSELKFDGQDSHKIYTILNTSGEKPTTQVSIDSTPRLTESDASLMKLNNQSTYQNNTSTQKLIKVVKVEETQ